MGDTGDRLLEYIHNKRREEEQSSAARHRGNSFAGQLRSRFCSDSCLKFVYLSCATLISATFIIECILLHLIIVPYLAESAFDQGDCRYISSDRDQAGKRCENKCSKERSHFPCLWIKVLFTPSRRVGQAESRASEQVGDQASTTISTQPGNASSTTSRYVFLYDYYSTFAAHKASRCSTSPCHRREEDNREAVEEFKQTLQNLHTFPCYARPARQNEDYWEDQSPDVDANGGRILDEHQLPAYRTPKDAKDASAILHRLYSRNMFMHSLCWPVGLFLGALLIIFFVYLIDGCQAWASDKTVIA